MPDHFAFRDRKDAGELLGGRLAAHGYRQPLVVVLSPGAALVGYEVAKALDACLDPLLVRRLAPRARPDLRIATLVEGRAAALDQASIGALGVDTQELAALVRAEQEELSARARAYRNGRAACSVRSRSTIVVDDGLSPVASLRAALRALRAEGPRRLVLALPVATEETLNALAPEADEILCLLTKRGSPDVREAFEALDAVSDEDAAGVFARAHCLEEHA